MKINPFLVFGAAAALLLIGRCSAPDVSSRERENWRNESRLAIARKNLVIDSLIERGLALEQLAARQQAKVDTVVRVVEAIPEPDTTPSDSARYWKAKAEGWETAYRGQVEVTISERLRASLAEEARDSLRVERDHLKNLLAQGVHLDQGECEIIFGINCPSRMTTGALALVGGVLLGVSLSD
jgi:hypothetical protein